MLKSVIPHFTKLQHFIKSFNKVCSYEYIRHISLYSTRQPLSSLIHSLKSKSPHLRYLELLATERGSYDAAQVMKSLSVLEEMCPTRHEYTALCYLLTRPHLKQHPTYSSWTHYQSRLECFEAVNSSLLVKQGQSVG